MRRPKFMTMQEVRLLLSAKGTETCEDMFSAFNEIKNNPESSAKSGVCRDHTVCLATMIAEMCPKIGKTPAR